MKNRFIRTASLACCGAALALISTAAAAAPAAEAPAAQYGRTSQTVQANISNAQLQQLLTRIRTDADALRRAVEQDAPRGRAVGNARAQQRDESLYLVDDLLQAAESLNLGTTRSRVYRQDIEDVLRHASDLDRSLTTGNSRPAVRTAWTRVRSDLDQLASAYSIRWNWANPEYTTDNAASYRFGGTYRLSANEGDNPRTVADRALRNVASADRARVSRQLENRLTPPDVISIERDNNGQFTLASSDGPRVTFTADGQQHTEQGVGGRDMTTRVTAHGDQVEVSTYGTNGSDYSVTFESLDDGRTLEVTRRLYDDTLRTPVVVRSVYHRTSDVADWNVYTGTNRRAGSRTSSTSSTSNVIVPTNTTFVATLNQPLNLRTARDGQRITMTVVDGPSGFRNATIEGYVSTQTTGNNTNGVGIDFDQIRMTNGRTAQFYGTIEQIRDTNGRNVDFDHAEVDNGSQRDRAIERGTIGAAIGAAIGAVLGGGKGAAVGAVIGAGGGAGTVLINNQTPASLASGTEFTIRSGTLEFDQ
jgi:hypothetical protein